MANEGSTKPTYSELEAQLAELKRGLRNNNSDFELAFLDHYLDHFKTLTNRAETAETSLARVRGLLQRLTGGSMACIYCGQDISQLANGATVCTSSANISEPDTVGNKHHVTLAFRDLNKESEHARQMMRDGDTEGLAAYANAGNRARASEIIRKRYAITPERIAEAKRECIHGDDPKVCISCEMLNKRLKDSPRLGFAAEVEPTRSNGSERTAESLAGQVVESKYAAPSGAESADIGKLDTVDESGNYMTEQSSVDIGKAVYRAMQLVEYAEMTDSQRDTEKCRIIAAAINDARYSGTNSADKSGVEMGKVNRVEEIDEQFKGMATDETYQAETLKIEKEFAHSDWEALQGSAETGGEKAAPDHQCVSVNDCPLCDEYIEQPITCEQCGRVFEHGQTDASARFDFCSQDCEDKYRARQSSHKDWIKRLNGCIRPMQVFRFGAAHLDPIEAGKILTEMLTAGVVGKVERFMCTCGHGLSVHFAERGGGTLKCSECQCGTTFPRSSQNQTVSSGVEGAHEGMTADKSGLLPTQLPKEKE